jgi:hypothetical protein
MVVPKYIRSVGDGTVELLAGREPGETTYIIELYLHPNYTETPTEITAPWFLALLTAGDGSYHTFAEEVHHLDDPAALAEVYCFQQLEARCNELTTELNWVSDALTMMHDQLDTCHCHMEAAQLPRRLQHLEDSQSFVPRINQLGRRCRGTPRRCNNGGGPPPYREGSVTTSGSPPTVGGVVE